MVSFAERALSHSHTHTITQTGILELSARHPRPSEGELCEAFCCCCCSPCCCCCCCCLNQIKLITEQQQQQQRGATIECVRAPTVVACHTSTKHEGNAAAVAAAAQEASCKRITEQFVAELRVRWLCAVNLSETCVAF